MEEKIYTIFAGVNGAGKSTLYQQYKYNPNEARINSDEIVQKIGSWKNDKDQMMAAKIAVQKIKECMENGESFNQETTLAGKSILKTIEKAKNMGYKIYMHYVGLESADLAKERVKQRVLKGGHSIPEDIIEKRYKESMENLKKIIPMCDRVKIYDNTNKFKISANIEQGNIIWKTSTKWLNPILLEVEENKIKQVLQQAGFTSTHQLIENMKRINHTFNKEHTVKEIKELYKDINLFEEDKKEVLNKVIKDFIEQEKQQIAIKENWSMHLER